MLHFDGKNQHIPPDVFGIEVYESLRLSHLVAFCNLRGLEYSDVEISSAGDPPTPITWWSKR